MTYRAARSWAARLPPIGQPMKFKKPKHVVIAIPAYLGEIKIGTFRSLLGDVIRLYDRGDIVQVVEETGNADISLCRAMIVAKFLANKDATHLVMVDSDVAWEPGALVRLIDANEDVVAGIYPRRVDDAAGRFHCHLLDQKEHTIDGRGLLEVEAVPAGFVCIKRHVLEAMCEHYADTKISFKQCPEGVAWDLFDGIRYTDPDDGLQHKYGEDYSFCKRWRQMGGKIHIIPNIHMGHIGPKIWQASFSEALKPVTQKVEAAA